jgi:2-polyprenyl-6-methoxyphenol hydroxylase-like FAD-dependent oxidoreductase
MITRSTAAHKLLPSSGSGAVNAMQDAVILANHIYDIRPTSNESIKQALRGYRDERFADVKEQYPQSYMAAKLMYGHVSNLFHFTTFPCTIFFICYPYLLLVWNSRCWC